MRWLLVREEYVRRIVGVHVGLPGQAGRRDGPGPAAGMGGGRGAVAVEQVEEEGQEGAAAACKQRRILSSAWLSVVWQCTQKGALRGRAFVE